MLILTNATLLCRWILREVEAVFSSGHFLLVNRTLASRHILGNNRWQSQETRLEFGLGFQPWIPTGKQSGLSMHTAMTESASLCVQMKSWLPLWNWKGRFVSAYWLSKF